MLFRRRGRPDPEAAERLLDGVAEEYTGSRQARREPADPLADLLAVAAAPARPGELAGEDAAVAAFRAARDARTAAGQAPALAAREAATRTVPAGTSSGRATAGRRRLTVGAGGWIAVAVATLTAGVALAADIPALLPAGPPRATPSVDTGTTSPTMVPAPTTIPPGAIGSGPDPSRSGQAHPPQSIVGQCRAFLAKGDAKPDAPADRPPSADLVGAAGGPTEVDGYCRRLLATDTKPGKTNPTPDRNDSVDNSEPDDSADSGSGTDPDIGRAPVDPPSSSPSREHGGSEAR